MCAINLKVIVSMPQSQLRGLIKSNQWGWWWQQLLNNYLKSTLFLSHTPLVYSWIVNTIRCSQSCIKQLVFTLYIKCALRQYYIIYNIQHCINTNYIYIFIKCSVRLEISVQIYRQIYIFFIILWKLLRINSYKNSYKICFMDNNDSAKLCI